MSKRVEVSYWPGEGNYETKILNAMKGSEHNMMTEYPLTRLLTIYEEQNKITYLHLSLPPC